MKTSFAMPSNSYNIFLSKEDLVKLVTEGALMYQPLHVENVYHGKHKEHADGHYLQYHGPEPGCIPVQFVTIHIEKPTR